VTPVAQRGVEIAATKAAQRRWPWFWHSAEYISALAGRYRLNPESVFKRDSLRCWRGKRGANQTQGSRPERDSNAILLSSQHQFVSFVLDDGRRLAGILQQRGVTYRHAKLVLYRDLTPLAAVGLSGNGAVLLSGG